MKLKPIDMRDYSPIREEVFTMLREAILTGELRPGDRLIERELAEQLGVSRTPVREAIRKLELERLVTHIPRKGVIVSEISREDVVEIFDIRASLEGLIARQAAVRITLQGVNELQSALEPMDAAIANQELQRLNDLHEQFNDTVYQAADSPRLLEMINSLTDYVSRFTKVGYQSPGRLRDAQNEHRELVVSIANRDEDRAEQIAKLHIQKSKEAFLRSFDLNYGYQGSKDGQNYLGLQRRPS